MDKRKLIADTLIGTLQFDGWLSKFIHSRLVGCIVYIYIGSGYTRF